MKYNLLGAVSTIALGAAFGIGTPGAANAALTCVGTLTSGTCSETDKATATKQDFTNIAIPVDFFTAPNVGNILKSVTYSVGGTIKVAGNLSNTGAGTATGKFNVATDNFTFAGGTPSSFLVPTVTINGSAFGSPTVTLNPGQKSPFSISNTLNAGPFNPTTAGYTNTGTFNALVNSTTRGGAVSSPSNFSATQTTNATAFVTITYAFSTPPPPPPPPSPTPEPASLALLGVGLAGLGAIRRRRKA